MVRQEGGRINRPGSIRKDQAPSPVNIFLDPLGIYLCRINDAVILHKQICRVNELRDATISRNSKIRIILLSLK
jgi:hypothetical protein